MTLKRQKDAFEITEISRRLKVLMLADKLGSVSEACEQMDFPQTQFYHYKKSYEAFGIEGLKIHYHSITHPNTTPEWIQEKVLELSILNPDFGAQHLSSELKSIHIQLGTATVHKILKDHNLTSRKSRWIFLENLSIQENVETTPQQKQFLFKMNPCHLEAHHRGEKPGMCLVQDCVIIQKTKSHKIYLHYVIDTFSNLAFGKVNTSVTPLPAMTLLQESVFPFYHSAGFEVQEIITHKGRTFSGNMNHDFELLMKKYEIKHTITRDGHGHGFSKQFKNIVANELIPFVSDLSEESTKLETAVNSWLHSYNFRKASLGFPNYGKFPAEVHASALHG